MNELAIHMVSMGWRVQQAVCGMMESMGPLHRIIMQLLDPAKTNHVVYLDQIMTYDQ